MLVARPEGGFRFLAAPGRPFSGGAVCDAGFGLAHAIFARPLPLVAGLDAALRWVVAAGRPVEAICGFELRIPAPFDAGGFEDFNGGYVSLLRERGVAAGDLMPAARTSVAVAGVIAEPSVYAVTYTVAADGPGWVVSGAPEPEPGTVAEMLAAIVGELSGRLDELGGEWPEATGVNLYGEDVDPAALLPVLPGVAVHGVRWYPSLPPIAALRLEVDARCASVEPVIPAS